MNAKFSLVAISVCLVALLSGVMFHFYNSSQDQFTVRRSEIPENLKKEEKPAKWTPPPPLPVEDISGMDDYTVANRYVNRLDSYIRNKQYSYAMQNDPNFSLVKGRLTPEQRFQIKLRIIETVKPVFKSGDPNLGMKLLTYPCGMPSRSPSPLILSNKIADIAEILINRGESSGSQAIYFYSDRMSYYLRTATSIMNEYRAETADKVKTRNRIEKLKAKLKTLKENAGKGQRPSGPVPGLYKDIYHWPGKRN